ncbi:hypothetical protein ACTS94_05025 [Empedobacter falsenii]
MKRILLFAFLMLVVSVNAQTKYNSLSEEQKQEMINSIISETGKSFVLDEEDKKGNKFYYTYVNKNDPNDNLIITALSFMEGENKTLEIKGVQKWAIYKISGKYLSLFPFWKNNVDKNADKEKLSLEKGWIQSGTKPYEYMMVNLKPDDNFWQIVLPL